MSKQAEKEIFEKLQALLQGQDKDIKRISKLFKLNYTNAALLLLNFHMNEMHTIAGIWYQANVKPKEQKP
jgi:hypothetical protein